MFSLLQKFFAPSTEVICEESDIYSILIDMQERIEKLESENIELTNALYECENRLESKIDKIHPVIYNIGDNKSLENFTLGE
jgi:hypothetical protein